MKIRPLFYAIITGAIVSTAAHAQPTPTTAMTPAAKSATIAQFQHGMLLGCQKKIAEYKQIPDAAAQSYCHCSADHVDLTDDELHSLLQHQLPPSLQQKVIGQAQHCAEQLKPKQ